MKRVSSLFLTFFFLFCAVSVSGQPMGNSRLTFQSERWAGNYTSLNALVAAHIAQTPSIVPERALIDSTLPLSANLNASNSTLLTLVKVGAGMIDCNGFTFTVYGPLDIPLGEQFFTNCPAGSIKLKIGKASALTMTPQMFGGKGDGTEAGAAIQAAISAATYEGNGGRVFFPHGTYTSDLATITCPSGTTLEGEANFSQGNVVTPTSVIINHSLAAPLLDCSSASEVHIKNLAFLGPGAVAGSIGVYCSTACNMWNLDNVRADNFGDQSFLIGTGGTPGAGGSFRNLSAINGLLVTAGRTTYVGSIDIGVNDARMDHLVGLAASTGVGGGFRAGVVYRGAGGAMNGVIGQLSEVGIVLRPETGLPTGGTSNHVVNSRADLNYGPGWVIASDYNVLTNNLSYRNGQATDNTYSGFVVTGKGNSFTNNEVRSLAEANRMNYAFTDQNSAAAGTENANKYSLNIGVSLRTADPLVNMTGSADNVAVDLQAKQFANHQGGFTAAGQVLVPDGAVGAPAIARSAATNTGIYWTATQAIFAFGGANSVIINSSSNLLVPGAAIFGGSQDLAISRDGAGVQQLGVDAATPVAQELKGCDGVGTDKAGCDVTFAGGHSTGTGTPGIPKVANNFAAGSTGSAQNTDVVVWQWNNGHPESAGTTPLLAAGCGTGATIAGTDAVGRITTNATAFGTCSITFNKTWTNAPVCLIADETTTLTDFKPVATTTTLTFNGTGITGADVLTYVCFGRI